MSRLTFTGPGFVSEYVEAHKQSRSGTERVEAREQSRIGKEMAIERVETPDLQRRPNNWALACLISIPLIILNCYWIANSEMRSEVTEVTISSLFMGVTAALFFITLLNLAVRRIWPKLSLQQGEMMVIYVMLSISSVVAGVGNYGFLLPFLGNAVWYAEQDGWKDKFLPLLPSWFGPRDKEGVLRPFYEGHSHFFQPQILSAWAAPLIVLGIFFMVLVWTMLCISAILRRQWADNEHLTFPVVTLPVEMTRADATLYRNRLLWWGFFIPLVIQSMNVLNGIFPTLPSFQINHIRNLSEFVRERPWNGIDDMPYALHPCGVGLGFLVSTDTLFGCWFFYLLFKLLNVFGVAVGWRSPALGSMGLGAPFFPYTGYQSWGAWLALSLMSLWMARPHLRQFLRKAMSGRRDAEDNQEPMTPREALFGLVAGFLAMSAFGVHVGMSLWLAPTFLIVYILLQITLSRIRAEAAIPSHELIWVNPQGMLTKIIGTDALSKNELTGTALFSWFNTDYRAAPMPHEIESFKGLQLARARLRPIVGCILLAALVAVIAASLCDLQLYYQNGAGTGKVNLWRRDKGNEPWHALNAWWDNPRPGDPVAILGMIAGALITVVLSVLRTRWVGFPFHPAAYVLNTSFAMEFFWVDFLAAWICKIAVLRYGGMKAYRLALPFFLGLVLGDFVAGSLWSVVGVILNLTIYRTFAT